MFKITWDKENNGVLLSMRSSEETLNVPPRPVFFEELDLLGLNKYWKYPESKEPLLWACNRRYFYKGELVLEAKGGNIYDDPQLIFTDLGKELKLKPINLELLCKKNGTQMFLIEHEALEFINTIYRRYRPNAAQKTLNESVDFQELAEILEKKQKEKFAVIKEDCDSFDIMPLDVAEKQGKQIVLNNKIEMFIASFSGGKDSQVVLDLVSRVIPSNDFLVIYSDTGYEIPPSLEIYEQTKKLYKKQYPDLQFYLSKNHQDVLYYWDKMGSPSRMHRWCCGVMKTAPLYRLLKEIHGTGKQPNVLVFEGVRAEESNRRALYDRIGRGVKHNNVVNARPIFEWNATEIYLYLFRRQLPINEGYRNGLSRVGCSICPYSTPWSEHIIEKSYPNNVNKFVKQIFKSLSDIKDKDVYLKDGNWKHRAGGKTILEERSRVDIISTNPDFVAFDEIQTIIFQDPPEMQAILKSYLEAGNATVDNYKFLSECSTMLMGNIELTSANLPRHNKYFAQLPESFRESALLDRFQGFIEGWYLPRMNKSMILKDWTLNVEYFSEVLHLLRTAPEYSMLVNEVVYSEEKSDLRDLKAVQRIASAYSKLLFPQIINIEELNKDEFKLYCLTPAIRRRGIIKEQCHKIDEEFKEYMPEIRIK